LPTDDDPRIPLAQAAMRLGIANSVAYARVRQGTLHATFVKGKLMLLPDEVERYCEEMMRRRPHGKQRGGRPKKPAQ